MTTVIIGAGIMGLMCARALAQKGESVILCEKQAFLGQQASWAGGGMGMPLYPWNGPHEISLLIKRAYDLYPSLVDNLHKETGIDSEWRQTGVMTWQADAYSEAMQWAQKYDFPLQLVLGGIWMPTVCQIRNPHLLKALEASIRKMPLIRIVTNAQISDFKEKNKVISHVNINGENVSVERVVLTAGAWSNEILKKINTGVPIFPMRGQMLLWKVPTDLLPHMLVSEGRYLIPRADGHILVGSSMEDVGFDSTTTEEQYKALKAFAQQMVPALSQYPIVQQWAGLRPAVKNGIPFMGRVSDFDNVWINAGHFRNGILFAPAATELLVDMIQEKKTVLPSDYYRF